MCPVCAGDITRPFRKPSAESSKTRRSATSSRSESCYNGGTLWHRGDKPKWSRMEYQIRNWLYFHWLSGDHICEQAVHSLDKTGWLQGDEHSDRGRSAPAADNSAPIREFGDIYDHHTVFYEYPNGVHVHFMCRQQSIATPTSMRSCCGTKGHANILEYKIEGENSLASLRRPGKEKHGDMYDLEHVALFNSIRDGKPINNGHYMANSTMLAVMGRMCTYTGQTLTWDQCMNSQEKLGPRIRLERRRAEGGRDSGADEVGVRLSCSSGRSRDGELVACRDHECSGVTSRSDRVADSHQCRSDPWHGRYGTTMRHHPAGRSRHWTVVPAFSLHLCLVRFA